MFYITILNVKLIDITLKAFEFFSYICLSYTLTLAKMPSHISSTLKVQTFHVTVQQPEEQLTGKLPLQAETINVITMQKFAYGECCT